MKILMINSVCGIGSTGRICTDLATELEKQGHEVKIAYGRGEVPKQFKKYAVKVGTELDVRMHALKARLFDKSGFGSKDVTRTFIQWVKNYDPDIIHLHNIHGYYINIEILFDYLKRSNKKLIWTLHDCWCFTGHTAYCDIIECERWENGCYNCPLLKEYPLSLVDHSRNNWLRKKETFTGIANMTIITPSDWLANLVKRSFLQNYSVKIINNGINTRQFYPVESDFRKENGLEGKYILLGVSTSWDKNKGLFDYIKLADILGDEYKVVLVGLTKKQKKQLPSNVIGIERTASVRELAEIYTTANLFLNLSYCENYPMVNIEAMACDTPVLTYQTGGSTEIVLKYGGEVIEKGNINGVAEKIHMAKEKKINVLFSPKENDICYMIKMYLDVYSSI